MAACAEAGRRRQSYELSQMQPSSVTVLISPSTDMALVRGCRERLAYHNDLIS